MANHRNTRAREQRLRRLAHRHGLRLEKSRLAVVYGGIPSHDGATLDEIERF